MKKIFIITGAALAMVSCSKDYTCSCTNTSSSNGNANVTTDEYTLKQVTKKYVESSQECVSYESQSVSQNGDLSTNTVDCTISEM